MPRPDLPDQTGKLRWIQVALVVLGVSVSGLILAVRLPVWLAPSTAPLSSSSASSPSPPVAAPSPAASSGDLDPARQVTVFAIEALPGDPRIDPRLSSVKAQLRKVLPNHGFELLEVQSARLDPGETLTCDLGRGWRAETTLEPPSADDFGRVRLHCALFDGDQARFSTQVDAPENQLFFYERSLRDGMRVLIGVGAR